MYAAVLPTADEYTIHDYECHEFAALVTLNTEQQSLFDQMVTLFGLIDRHWDSHFACYRVTQVRPDDGTSTSSLSRCVAKT